MDVEFEGVPDTILVDTIHRFPAVVPVNLPSYHPTIKGRSKDDIRAERLPLAAAGLNIVLISRTEAKLQAVAADLESRFSVQTKVIAADFAAAGGSVWESIAAVVSGLPVGLLINSAGVSYDHAGAQMVGIELLSCCSCALLRLRQVEQRFSCSSCRLLCLAASSADASALSIDDVQSTSML